MHFHQLNHMQMHECEHHGIFFHRWNKISWVNGIPLEEMSLIINIGICGAK
jgi:hypothetical protein